MAELADVDTPEMAFRRGYRHSTMEAFKRFRDHLPKEEREAMRAWAEAVSNWYESGQLDRRPAPPGFEHYEPLTPEEPWEMGSKPVVEAYRTRATDGSERLRFYCPYCDGVHTHSPEEGHRVAHCYNPNSPYKSGGYILKEIPTPPAPGG